MLMSITGFCLLAFLVVHLLGNTTIYAGPDGINAYARALHRFPFFLWLFRLILITFFYLHLFYGIQLTLENRAAKTKAYAISGNVASTFAGRNMIWTGLLIGFFVGFHLLHFTVQIIDPDISASLHPDAMGRPDVFMMVVLSFRKLVVAALYVCAMAVLGLHLMHSIQSAFQTMGMNSERTFPVILKAGMLAAILISLGYAAFPVTIFAGLLR